MVAKPSVYSTIPTPVGPLCAGVSDDGVLLELWLPNRKARHRNTDRAKSSKPATHAIDAVTAQLAEYFDRKRRTFDVLMEAQGTDFEQRVWRRLLEIPFGATTTYGQIAKEFGLENGARAVGRANGCNPIPIIIPCHRVIGADGALIGFGGGLPLKRSLLEHEGALMRLQMPLF